MKLPIILVCIIGSLLVGGYTANIFYKNYILSKFPPPSGEVLSVEQYKSFQYDELAEFTRDLHIVLFQQTDFAKEQQINLRFAILVLGGWCVFLLLVISLSRTKAFNKALNRTFG
jgi:hypothetical protein